MNQELRIFGTYTAKYGLSNSIVYAVGIGNTDLIDAISCLHEKIGYIRLSPSDTNKDYTVPSIVFDRTLLDITLSKLDIHNLIIDEIREFLKADTRSNYIVLQVH